MEQSPLHPQVRFLQEFHNVLVRMVIQGSELVQRRGWKCGAKSTQEEQVMTGQRINSSMEPLEQMNPHAQYPSTLLIKKNPTVSAEFFVEMNFRMFS